jgi:predicted RNA-binding Zn-ribbon protein involved in translation (DUF1610 family)
LEEIMMREKEIARMSAEKECPECGEKFIE